MTLKYRLQIKKSDYLKVLDQVNKDKIYILLRSPYR
jgi:hypothetical protein